MDYSKSKELFEDLRNLAKKYNIAIVTATQPQRKSDGTCCHLPRRTPGPDLIIIDHLSLIK